MTDRIQTVVSEKGRRIVGRLLPGTDLIRGILMVCRQNEVSCGTIISAIGSLTEANIIYAVADQNAKIGIRYSDPVRIQGPLELLSCQGMIGHTVDGQPSVHLHGLMSNPEMIVYGGHFLEDGNPVLATAEFLIQDCSDIRMVREQDAETGFPLLKFYRH